MGGRIFEGEKRAFMTGNEAVAWAALAAGADIMYGYPITPQMKSCITGHALLPSMARISQTEDEISAGFTTVGEFCRQKPLLQLQVPVTL